MSDGIKKKVIIKKLAVTHMVYRPYCGDCREEMRLLTWLERSIEEGIKCSWERAYLCQTCGFKHTFDGEISSKFLESNIASSQVMGIEEIEVDSER